MKNVTENPQQSQLKNEGNKGSKRKANPEGGTRMSPSTSSEIEHFILDLLSVYWSFRPLLLPLHLLKAKVRMIAPDTFPLPVTFRRLSAARPAHSEIAHPLGKSTWDSRVSLSPASDGETAAFCTNRGSGLIVRADSLGRQPKA